MEAVLTGLLYDEVRRGLEVLHAFGNIRVALGARRSPIPLEVHRPDVKAVVGEHVHQRVFAAPGYGQIECRTARDRRAVHQKEHRQRLLARLRRALPLAEDVELHVAFLRPVLVRPQTFCRLRRSRSSGKRGEAAESELCEKRSARVDSLAHATPPRAAYFTISTAMAVTIDTNASGISA